VNLKVQAMPFVHFSPPELEVFSCPPARQMIPPIREKHAANIHKQAGNVRHSE
jgi:hypothetical protein